jgi:hypothetical protein
MAFGREYTKEERKARKEAKLARNREARIERRKRKQRVERKRKIPTCSLLVHRIPIGLRDQFKATCADRGITLRAAITSYMKYIVRTRFDVTTPYGLDGEE